ncbi:MAG: hypothetical protein OIF36_04030 [Alphaproteobacteria bacterium]|jgi:hypothetical protein|nr:hypothetical protein [Alphaproteobacteria bacterium]MCV6599628.1 hypothetical protein [Alphaproteobacteria bacterium]
MKEDLIIEKIKEESKVITEESLKEFEEKTLKIEEKIKNFIKENSQ